jgi:DNA-binding transcriptional MerR regulator/methylmalonyl-CoA mutase cobalamin-binding subunit
MDNFTIKDLENLSGIKAHTIRIWEQRYQFLKPKRTATNIRFYSNEELKTILNVSLLTRHGFKISHIDKMNTQQIREKITSLSDAQAQKEKAVNELLQQMIDLDISSFEKLIDNHIITKGVERTVTQIIFAFLEKTGVLWQTGNINPAQEHLVTNIIRQKLIVAIDACHVPVKKITAAMLFLPEGEYHELGILYISYLLKKAGIAVYYLGANVPFKDAEYVARLKKPDVIFIHLTNAASTPSFSALLKKTKSVFPGSNIYISGAMARDYKKQPPPGIAIKKSLAEITELVSVLS